jgi:D-arabinose 1-dehydrogenase-like Zn-dependent alcohol dehydrogenase
MSLGKQILIVGPGFIGWNILDLLIGEGCTVIGYGRRKEHAKQIEQSGAVSVLGDLNDTALITKHTLDHDIVFYTATADHQPSAEAIIEGLRQRASGGKSTIYIHTSGTVVLDDNAKGGFQERQGVSP